MSSALHYIVASAPGMSRRLDAARLTPHVLKIGTDERAITGEAAMIALTLPSEARDV